MGQLAKQMDWGGISKDVKGKLIYFASAIRKDGKRATEAFLAMCQAVAEANDLLATSGCGGKFSEWVEVECGISRRSAYEYLSVAKYVEKRGLNCASDAQLSPSALIELAKADTPESVRAEVEESGGLVTKKDVVQKKQAAKTAATELVIDLPDTVVEEPEYEDVDPPEAPEPEKPNKGEQIQKLKSVIRQHNSAMMRAADDLNVLKKNKSCHESVHEYFRAIALILDQWE